MRLSKLVLSPQLVNTAIWFSRRNIDKGISLIPIPRRYWIAYSVQASVSGNADTAIRTSSFSDSG
jgi:hypothetical protein